MFIPMLRRDIFGRVVIRSRKSYRIMLLTLAVSVSFLRVNGLKRRCRHRLDTPLDLKLRIYGCVSKAGALIWKSDVRKLITKNGSSSHWSIYVKKSENSWMDDLFTQTLNDQEWFLKNCFNSVDIKFCPVFSDYRLSKWLWSPPWRF